ncbi:MAG: hypothetical protein IPJ82_08175 [Lewinellaceae bacterium]|nr:hypothetical protein [Lewinellaceae bacterium]
MQKYCLSVLLFALCSPIRAQEMAVMLDKMNVLYTGLDNPFHIVVSDVASQRLVLSPSQGVILADSSGTYLWRLCACNSDKAWMVISDSLPGNIIDTVFFRVKRLPEPRFEVSKRGHHSNGGVTGYFDHISRDYLRPEIIGFDLEYLPEKQDPMIVHNTGARFNGEAAHCVLKLKPGDHFFIYGITWRAGCDPTVRKSEEILGFSVK